MPYVVTDACEKDFLCVNECPVEGIAPKEDDPRAETVSQVFISPEICIECGACAGVCPHNAIFAESDLPADKTEFAAKNAEYFS
jgi:NAD-dependent dihydropyrimidine dehydrogenase PreA subunit